MAHVQQRRHYEGLNACIIHRRKPFLTDKGDTIMTRKYKLFAALALIAAFVLFPAAIPSAEAATPVSSSIITPDVFPGNPTCYDLGYAFGFKINQAPNGTFTLTNAAGELMDGAPADPNNAVTIGNSDGNFFDWSATLGIDAIIVKGGPNASAFVYSGEDTADTRLHAPVNPSSGEYYGISHVEFCYDYELTVGKGAGTTFTRTFAWAIEKSVAPEQLEMFTGDSGAVEYTVAVQKSGYTDSNWAVAGDITIANNTPFGASIASVADVIAPNIVPALNCGVGFPYTLAPGATLTCSYASALPDGTNRVNTATVTTSGTVGGGSATADVIFGEPTTKVNDTVHVSDTNGASWPVGDSGTVRYGRTFTCDADEGQHDNTATIVETGQFGSASVVVKCYALQVAKRANTSFTRTWGWSIEKRGDQSAITLSPGQQFLVNYDVTVDATATDSAWAVNGAIAVHNPAPITATLTGVADVVSPDISATVDCGVNFPHVLAAGGTLDCSYSADLPDATNRTNTATASLKNTPGGTTDFSGSADVNFGDTPTIKVDECIVVADDKGGNLGKVCAGEAPKTFAYALAVGPYNACGLYDFVNIAGFVTNDTGATGSDNWTVAVDIPCGGCTLTQGYWKTHSEFGPAPYDDTWAQLPNGASTVFFLSGKSWYEAFRTPPAGNAYYNLAHQYMAASLNLLNGAASTPEVNAAIAWAESRFFNLHGPNNFPKNLRNQVLQMATTLDKYNNGLVGPGHCSGDVVGAGAGDLDAAFGLFMPLLDK
jgi:hypothetical protein